MSAVPKTCVLQINRASAFQDASLGLQAADKLCTTGPCVVSPSFITSVSTYSTAHLCSGTEANNIEAHHSEAHLSEAQRCEAHESEAQQASLEEGGEGYGPRREFFLLAGQAMIKQAAGELAAECTQQQHSPHGHRQLLKQL